MRKAQGTGLTCTSCGEASVIQIDMSLPDGTDVVFNSCHVCENKWWDRDGVLVEVDGIIDLVSE